MNVHDLFRQEDREATIHALKVAAGQDDSIFGDWSVFSVNEQTFWLDLRTQLEDFITLLEEDRDAERSS